MNSDPISHVDLIICDLEATCWDIARDRNEMETIEIGAVRMHQGIVVSEFNRFIKPSIHPLLSDFCKGLTTIRQDQVDSAQSFTIVFSQFLDWIGAAPFLFCSWGRYDVSQLQLDTGRHGLPWPAELDRHLNIRHLFAQWRNVKPCGMDRALELIGLPLEGTHHRGLDDAHNIARLTRMMLPWLLQTQTLLL